MSQDHTTYSIGAIARWTGLTLRTLRYYEELGLIKPARKGLARIYSDCDIERIQVIGQAKEIGFTLREICSALKDDASAADMLELLEPCEVTQQLEVLERQRARIETAIAALQAKAGVDHPTPMQAVA